MVTQGESDMKPSFLLCSSERVVAVLHRTVFYIYSENQRLTKKYLLYLSLRHIMLFVFSSITSIPFKADDVSQVHPL